MKKRIMEIIILIILIVTLILTCIWAYKIFFLKKTNTPTNIVYEVPKKYYFKKNTLENLNIPENEKISFYQYFQRIETTDNIVKIIYEKIDIEYNDSIDLDIKKYCNTYNAVEYEYLYTCNYKEDSIHITHTYYIDNITNNNIKSQSNTINIIATKGIKYPKYIDQRNNEQYEKIDAF